MFTKKPASGSYKSVIIFSVLKYLEIILTSLTTFFLAKKLGPIQLGRALPVLLYITYANYLALGLNQVVTKNFNRIEEINKSRFLAINLQCLIITSFANILLSSFFVEDNYSNIVALISMLTIYRGFFSAYFRAVDRIRIININSIIFSFLLFIVVLFTVESLNSYLYSWSILLFIVLILFYSNDLYFFNRVFLRLGIIPTMKDVKFNIYEGIKLALIGLSTTILLTIDRLIINKLEIPLKLKGSFQLADSVGMAIYMVATTIIFYYYPSWIHKLRGDKLFIKRYLNNCFYIILCIPFILIIICLFGSILIPIFFPEYPKLLNITCMMLISKLSVISLSFVSLFYIGKDNESHYLKKISIPIMLIILNGFIVITKQAQEYLIVPLLNGIIIFSISIHTIHSLRNQYLKN
jgi:O-antigen/teichoic acid export membrane protein